jgi:beta-lactamase regulating signal transducer with metallopeptidase domain
MTEFVPVAVGMCIFLIAYLWHSTIAVTLTAAAAGRRRWVAHPELRVLVWKLALSLPIVSALAVTFFNLPHYGYRFQISIPSTAGAPASESRSKVVEPGIADLLTSESAESNGVDAPNRSDSSADRRAAGAVIASEERLPSSSLPAFVPAAGESDRRVIWFLPAAAWLLVAFGGLMKLGLQWRQLSRLRRSAQRVSDPELRNAAERLRNLLGIRRRIALLQSEHVQGPMTAGIVRPFILLPADMPWDDAARRDALLAHEMIHIARRDAFWNLAIQILSRVLPFQPLNRIAVRQLRREMDLLADALAAQSTEARIGLACTLVELGDRIAGAASPRSGDTALAACMFSFDSPLGRRIELLLSDDEPRRPANIFSRAAVVTAMVAGIAAISAAVPHAVAQAPHTLTEIAPVPQSRNQDMNKHLSTVTILAGLALPVAADEPQAKPEKPAETKAQSTELKTTPDPLPKGIRRFNGMLVGRLAAKDIEKGTFLVRVDAVPRVWENSNPEDPKSIVGKTVEVSGVFGRFLDVLVVTRAGETVEFECKHDGERLVFPGELLRKVAAFDPSDYPVLPEEFRGFQGSVAGTIVKKDPETFELIVKVERVTDTWKDNKAKEAKSIEGKPLMLAGFWNRKDAYHGLKVGDRIEAGMKHIGLRSDHLTVAESVRKAGEQPERDAPKKPKEPQSESEQTDAQRGFRGMLVGRLVAKDIERGTFTITVDAVPRVWNNNKSSRPKSLLGTNVTAEGVTGKMLDALVVARIGETIEFGALHDGEDRMRVGEVLRKVGPVKPGDYPVLPDEFRGFKGTVTAKVTRKDDHLMDMIVEITAVNSTFPASRAKKPESIVGKQAMLGGFWQRKEAFHGLGVGDTIECGIEHPQYLSDHLSVIESLKKVEGK